MPPSITLTNAHLITLTDRGALPQAYLRIEDGLIHSFGPMSDYQPSPGEQHLDLRGMTVLPGLIDAHCHIIHENAYPVSEEYLVRSTIAGVQRLRRLLEAGLTSVRDVGCRHLGIYALRYAMQAGEVPGPRFQTAGRPLAGTGISKTWRSYSHDGADAMLQGVRQEWQEGANWIKVSVSDGRWRDTQGWQDTLLISPDEIQAVVKEARRKDLRVACHVDGPLGARLAVEAGVDSIEHGVHIPPNLLDQMAEHGIFFVPTVWIYGTQDLKVFRADLAFLNDLHAETIRRARSAGVKIAAGVDYAFIQPMEGMYNELATLVACGLTQMEALQAATLRGAELMGWDDYLGSLTPGKLADLVVVDGNPLERLEALQQVVLILQGGRPVLSRLDALPAAESALLPDLLPSWMR